MKKYHGHNGFRQGYIITNYEHKFIFSMFQHIVKPENLYSHFDTPARVTINVKDWTPDSHIYMVVTSYKYLRQGQTCQEDKEFDCTSAQSFLSSNTDHMCMSMSLACDGIPNCGQDYLPNMDENCFKVNFLDLS